MQFKNVILLLIALFSYGTLSAQYSYEDVVHLKNGSIIKGIIIEQVPNVSIKIKSGENLFVFQMDEIEKITKDIVLTDSQPGSPGNKQRGFEGNYEIGAALYRTEGKINMFSFNIINGYRFNSYFSLGLGLGAEVSTINIFNFPAYADMRVYLLQRRVSPYINFAAGYNLLLMKTEDYSYYGYYSTQNEEFHGYMVSPALGVVFAINEKVGVTFSIGYKLVGYKVKGDYYYNENSIESLHGVLLRWGVNL